MPIEIIHSEATTAWHWPVKGGTRWVRFSLAVEQGREVFVAGNFNDWNARMLLLREAEPGLWRCELELPSGRIEYTFIVDGQWIGDPNGINEAGTNGAASFEIPG